MITKQVGAPTLDEVRKLEAYVNATLWPGDKGKRGDFLQGKESADQALADIEAAYIAAAKEKGFL